MRTKISLIAKATFSPAGEGHGPLPLPFWGMYLPEGPPGACVCLCALPLPAPSSTAHTRSASFPTPPSPPPPHPGPWPVCQQQPQQLAGSGRRANIYSSEAHPGPHRRTKDWRELASHQSKGQSWVFKQAPGLGWRSFRSFSCLCCHLDFLPSFKWCLFINKPFTPPEFIHHSLWS